MGVRKLEKILTALPAAGIAVHAAGCSPAPVKRDAGPEKKSDRPLQLMRAKPILSAVRRQRPRWRRSKHKRWCSRRLHRA